MLCALCLINGSTGLLPQHLRLGLEPIVQVRSVTATALFEQLVGTYPNDFFGQLLRSHLRGGRSFSFSWHGFASWDFVVLSTARRGGPTVDYGRMRCKMAL